MTDGTPRSEWLATIADMNLQPLNAQAGALLPPRWMDPGTLNILALVRWLVQEKGLESDFRPGVESVLAMLDKLERWPPKEAMDFVTTTDSGEPALVRLPDDQEKAAVELLQALVDKMVATAP